jgi:hypothetical protein
MPNTLAALPSLLLMSALGASPSAGPDFCWNVAPFGNILKLRFLAVGPEPARYLISGVDDVFDDHAVDGSASPGIHQPNTLRLGFSDHAHATGSTEIECNAVVSLVDGNGTYWCWIDILHEGGITGAFVFVPGCAGVPGVARGPDIRTAR